MWFRCSKSAISRNKVCSVQFPIILLLNDKRVYMKNLLLLLLLPGLSFGQNAANGFTVSGTVQGLTDGEVKIASNRGEVLTQGQSKAGVFSLKGTVAEPGLYQIVFGKEPHYLFLDNTAITLSGANAKAIKVSSPAAHNDPALFNQTFTPIFSDLDALGAQIKALPEEKKGPLVAKYQKRLADLQSEADKFIPKNPSSHVSLFLLSVITQISQNVGAIEKQYNGLSDALKNSAQGKEIATYISYAKVGAIGTAAIDFTQNDVNEKPVSLSSFKGKYVLVDFWASWCRPCRMENPNVVKVFNKFKDKNFTVLGISLDQQKEAWVNAIAKDRLTWTHVSDLQYWNNAVAQLYRVQSIPQNFLIDPSGKIVAKDLRGEDLEKKLCEYLGCN